MAPSRARLGLLVLVLLVSARAALADATVPALQRIRTFETRLRLRVEDGMRRSATFRALALRLEQSDLIVYLMYDVCTPPHIAGRLTFLSATGGVRYVVVRLRPLGSLTHEIAVLGHELQHAVEIAEHATIVDEQSLARAYMRIGHVNPSMPQGIGFDTRAAIDVGYQVRRELGAAGRDVDAVGGGAVRREAASWSQGALDGSGVR